MADKSAIGTLLSLDAAQRTKRAVKWVERNGGTPRRCRHSGDDYMPPIRGILLEDLVSEGQADCAVTVLDASTFIQELSIIGDVSGGTFQLAFKGVSTDNLPFNCSQTAMQTALENLSTIGKNNVVVRLGKQTYHNDDAGTDPIASPGIWIIEFVGTFAQSKTAPPLIVVTNQLTGPGDFAGGAATGLNAALIDAKTIWVDTGNVETVNALVPVGTPTPMRTGAVVLCVFFPGVGYGVVACECREFSQTYY